MIRRPIGSHDLADQSVTATYVVGVVADLEPGVVPCARGTGHPDGVVVDTLYEVPAGGGVLVDAVPQVVVSAQAHHVNWLLGGWLWRGWLLCGWLLCGWLQCGWLHG